MPVHVWSDARRGRVYADIKTRFVEAEAYGDFLDGPDHRSKQSPIQGGPIQDGWNVLLGDDDYVDTGMRLRVVKG